MIEVDRHDLPRVAILSDRAEVFQPSQRPLHRPEAGQMRMSFPRNHVDGTASRIGHGVIEHAMPCGLIIGVGIEMGKLLKALAVGIKPQHPPRVVEQIGTSDGIEKNALGIDRTDAAVVRETAASKVVGDEVVARVSDSVEDAAALIQGETTATLLGNHEP